MTCQLLLRSNHMSTTTAPTTTAPAPTPSTRPTAGSASSPATPWSPRSAARSTSSRAPATSTPRTRPARSLQLTIKAASIDTRNADRDGHLRSNDFFDMETYPEITFALDRGRADRRRRATGSPATSPSRASPSRSPSTSSTPAPPSTRTATPRIGLEGKTTVNRKDWGVNWNAALEAGGVLVSEKVTLEFEVSAIRTADAA